MDSLIVERVLYHNELISPMHYLTKKYVCFSPLRFFLICVTLFDVSCRKALPLYNKESNFAAEEIVANAKSVNYGDV